MEKLLHYVWQHKLFPLAPLTTSCGWSVEVIDPGLHNPHAGPDFFNAKVKIDGTLWVGNVEVHERASDWFRHHHDTDAAYANVILHVVGTADCDIPAASGRLLPQLVLPVPDYVARNYRELLEEASYPPCYRIIPRLPAVTAHSWLSALTAERLQEKTERIGQWLERTGGDWERCFFITLARSFGFGTNAEAFEEWAAHIPVMAIGKHRDNLFQIEAFFFGQAGLLDDSIVPSERRDGHFLQLQQEYRYLAHKFSLTPMDAGRWRFLRLRPQNFPHVRLAQLAQLYYSQRVTFSRLLEAGDIDDCSALFNVGVTPYWETHYTFGDESTAHAKRLQPASVRLLLINTVAPLLFAYGRYTFDEERCEKAFALLEALPAEQNFITRSWQKAGLHADNAADSQALIQLRHNYCDRKDCLRCRFGCEYLRQSSFT